jgi:hypothetical protein
MVYGELGAGPRIGRTNSSSGCGFEDLPLADFGNRIPNITAEITFHRMAAQPFQLVDLITTGEGGSFSGYQGDSLAIDWRRGHGWFLASNIDPALAGIRRFSLRTMSEDRQARMSDVTDATPANFPASLFCGEDGHLYLTVGSGNSKPIIRVEPNALKEVGRFGSTSSGLSNTTTIDQENDVCNSALDRPAGADRPPVTDRRLAVDRAAGRQPIDRLPCRARDGHARPHRRVGDRLVGSLVGAAAAAG